MTTITKTAGQWALIEDNIERVRSGEWPWKGFDGRSVGDFIDAAAKIALALCDPINGEYGVITNATADNEVTAEINDDAVWLINAVG